MPNDRRNLVAGRCFSFTVNVLDRQSDLLVAQIDLLRHAVRHAQARAPLPLPLLDEVQARLVGSRLSGFEQPERETGRSVSASLAESGRSASEREVVHDVGAYLEALQL